MKIAVLGGTFNPPHIGHLSYIHSPEVAAAGFDKILVIPSGDPPHKQLPGGSPTAAQRLEMARLTFEDTGAEVLDIEINRAGKSYTADTIRELMAYYPSARFTLLMGTDMFATLEQWYDAEWLQENTDIMVLDRSVIPISSTVIREELSKRQGREWLTEKNYPFLIKNNLYNAKPDWEWLWNCTKNLLTDDGRDISEKSQRRIEHTCGVEKAAIEIAEFYGADVEDARTAAILHDITKLKSYEKHLTMLKEYGIMSTDVEGEKLLHAITGAAVAYFEFGVSEQVRNAICWHTTGKANMSLLEKVVYLADFVEDTRDFPGVDALRKIVFGGIDEAMKLALTMSIEDVKASGSPLCKATEEALEFLISQ